MQRLTFVLIVTSLAATFACAQSVPSPRVPAYESNTDIGAFTRVNGISLYHESYGAGRPMLQIHGNGGSIHDLAAQIQFFSNRYRVIAADSRGHGKSELGSGRLTYEQMAEDLNALLDQLGLKSVYVLGWSDGGILGLLLAIHHPDKVGKLVIMGANIDPSAAHDWALQWAERESTQVDQRLAAGDKTRDWTRLRQQLNLLLQQPHIPVADLQRILVPTLVMASDKDVIREEHTLSIFHALPKAHLAILPGSTHFAPRTDAELFNGIVDRFFSQPFSRPETSDFIR